MILDFEEAQDRLSSEHNLINRLAASRLDKRGSKSQVENLYGIKSIPDGDLFNLPKGEPSSSPCLPPSAEELIADVESKLKLGLAHDGALEVLCDSVDLLKRNLVNMDPSQPQRVSRVAVEMARIIGLIDEVRNGSKSNSNSPTIIYKPVMLNETHYEVVQVHE